MNPIQRMLRQGARVISSPNIGGSECTCDGVKFIGRIEDANPIDYGLPLGEDSREQAVLYITPGQNAEMPAIRSQSVVTAAGSDERWKVVKRIQSSAAVTTQYYLAKE